MNQPIAAYVTQQCEVCKNVAIRVPIGATMPHPTCKWCVAKEESLEPARQAVDTHY